MKYLSDCNKIIKILLFVILISTSVFTSVITSAQSVVDYSLVTDNCDTDRIFDVDVVVSGSASLSAVNVSLSYDPDFIDFRSVKTADKNISIKSVTGDNYIQTVILCAYGYKFDRRAKLMTFKFKSLKSGKSKINLFVNDAVNKDLKSIPIGKVYSTNVEINSDGGVIGEDVKSSNNLTKEEIKEKIKSDRKQYKASSKANNKTSSKNVSGNKELKIKKTTQATTKQPGKEILAEEYNDTNSNGFTKINNEYDDSYKFIIGGIAVLTAVIVVYIFYNIGKSKGRLEEDDEDM